MSIQNITKDFDLTYLLNKSGELHLCSTLMDSRFRGNDSPDVIGVISSFPRESRSHYPDLLRCYNIEEMKLKIR